MTSTKQIVSEGYDRIAERYAAWAMQTRDEERERYTAVLLDGLRPGAAVLELGCGPGVPTTRRLAEQFDVTGVDLSARQIELARANVTDARFVHADMTTLAFAEESFDAVVAFYSLIHLPREELPGLVTRIAGWLRPGGIFVATMGAHADAGSIEEDWLGAPMYWSHFDSATNRKMVTAAGFEIVSAAEHTADEDGEPVTFLWIIARRPSLMKRLA
jgi:SAM-dependent methyltransferase